VSEIELECRLYSCSTAEFPALLLLDSPAHHFDFAALYLREFIGAKSGCIASQVTMKTVVEVSLTRRLCNLRSFGICQL